MMSATNIYNYIINEFISHEYSLIVKYALRTTQLRLHHLLCQKIT